MPAVELVQMIGLGRHAVANGVVVVQDVDGEDVGALFGQPDGVAASLPPACSRDEGHLALQTVSH